MLYNLIINIEANMNPVHNISIVTIQRNIPVQNIISSTRKRKYAPLTQSELSQGCRMGLDTHADISCLGRHARITSVIDGLECTVHAFNDSFSPLLGVKTVNGAIAVDSLDGQLYNPTCQQRT